VPAEEIAAAIGAPRNYLAKTLNALARRGYVAGTRGPGGGFQLAVDAVALPISRLIEDFDSSPPHVLCLLGGRPCNAATPCAAHDRWLRMWEESLAPLRSTTLADLLGRDEADPEISPYRDARGTLQLQRQG
jgi:Rrf2 family protein